MRTIIKLGLALVAVAAVATVVAVSTAAQPVRDVEQKRDDRFEVKITDEMVRHSRIVETLYFVGAAWSLGALALLLFSGASRKMRDAAARVTKRPFALAMIYIALFTIAVAILELPLAYYAGFVVPHQFDLTDQTLAGWIGDEAKGLAVGILMGATVGAFALMGMRSVRRWWLALWLGSIPIITLLVVIQPVVLDPIFNKFRPLEDQHLRQSLLDLASRAGIEGGRVYQVDKSKQTKTMNAYVNGIGPTRRIVMWDTLLAKLNEEEVLGVMGHEMGHYALNHMWKGLGLSLALALGIFFTGQKIHDRGLARWGTRWGVTGTGDPASVPWLLIIVGGISFLLSPVVSGYSRHVEHQADVFSLELTHLNEPIASAFVKMAEDSKLDPDPHPFIRFWRYSHPPISERIAFALSYRPWEKGEEHQLWTR